MRPLLSEFNPAAGFPRRFGISMTDVSLNGSASRNLCITPSMFAAITCVHFGIILACLRRQIGKPKMLVTKQVLDAASTVKPSMTTRWCQLAPFPSATVRDTNVNRLTDTLATR